MYMITAPIAEDLAVLIEPYRQKYDPLVKTMPSHISILKPFELSIPMEELYIHLEEIGDTFAPIKVSVIGWDAHQETCQLRLPLVAGRQEFATLRNNLLAGPLSGAAQPDEAYWPHITFGRFKAHPELETVKASLKGFEPKFVFRVNHLELMQRDHQSAVWQIQKKFGLNATAAGARRRKRTISSSDLMQS